MGPPEMALSDLEIMTASGLGAACAALFTNPLEVAKTRLQMQSELSKEGHRPYRNALDCLQKTWRSEGLRGVQRGVEIAVIRDGSKCFFRLGLYEPILRRLDDSSSRGAGDGGVPFYKLLFAGSVSGLVSAIVCNPLDIVKVRVQSAGGLSTSHHDLTNLGLGRVFSKVLREEGLGGLWKGVQVNVLRSISFTSVLLAVNSRVKTSLSALGLRDGFGRDALGSFAGSFIGIFFMNPVDVVRTRIYNQPVLAPLYHGTLDAALKIARHEGPLAFWKGAMAHYLRVGPHTVLSFVLIGEIKRAIMSRKARLLPTP